MRSTVFAVLAALALVVAPWAGALAQDEAPKPAPKSAAAGAAAGLPRKPIPYTRLNAKPAKPKPKPAEGAAAASGAPSAAGAAAAKPPPVVAAPAPRTPAPQPAYDEFGPLPQAKPAPPPPQPVQPPARAQRLASGQAMAPAELEAFVDGVMKDAMGREHIAGAAVSVVQNGQLVMKKGYGFAGLNPDRPVDPDRTLFRIGSISKTFTWIAVMKEVEAGRIRLNQPVNLYLPEKAQVKDQGYDQPVRVANLMDHSAGFEDRALGQLFERDFDRVRPLDLYLRQERPRRVHAPGVVSSYSNYGAALAGEAVAWTSGKPYERLVEDEILNPLGMGHTSFREPHPVKAGLPAPMPAGLTGDVSDGYRWTGIGFHRRPYEFIEQIAPAGAGSSTAGDMAKYMLMMLGGGQLNGATIYGPTTAEAFRTPLRKTPVGINGWAHGLMVFDLPGGHRGYGHGGATLSFFSNMVVVPDLNLGIFVTTNTDTARPLVNRLPDRIVQHFYAPPEPFPRAGSPELVGRAGDFEGYYLTTRRAYSGLEGFVDQLTGGAKVSITHDGRLVTRDQGGVKTWSPEGPLDDGRFIASQGEERLAFDVADGQARAFHVASGTMAYERISLWRQPNMLMLLAALTAVAAVATLAGVPLRNRREFRQNQIQSRASLVQTIQAVLWLTSFGLFSLFLGKIGDAAAVMYSWPGFSMVVASAAALVSAGLTATTLLALPAVWRGGRRVDSWTQLRKAGFTVTVLVYLAFSVELAVLGALSPWNT
ncbi:serine hydrolase domain-containing protein [Phenylobacterium sp.]|jgi:CubicO group peptidase (beta-lactamase class C family)|uniref:serine hydrolase domain-containing protein n=1 Tax=Phenylobacterium sp. TaxID=1871053 RepID=UPI002F3FA9A9